MNNTNVKIISYKDDYKVTLKNLLREYLEYTARFLIEEPWKFSVDIEKELAKTFDNLDQFKAPKGEIFLVIFDQKVVGTASLKMIRSNASELKRMYIEPRYQRQKKGQLLMVLEAPEISSQLAASESRLRSQEAVYMASNSTYKRILETSKVEGTISKNDLEQSEARKNSDYAQLQAAKASYKEIQNIQGYLQIRAPFDGVVAARNVNLGAYVGPAGKGSELPLFTLQEQSKLRLSVYVPEMYTGYLKNGDEISFSVKSMPGQTFKAKVSRMSGALDSRLRSERVEMDVINTTKKLLPGMVAEVLLPLKAQDSNYVIPKTALVTSSEGTFVLEVPNNSGCLSLFSPFSMCFLKQRSRFNESFIFEVRDPSGRLP